MGMIWTSKTRTKQPTVEVPLASGFPKPDFVLFPPSRRELMKRNPGTMSGVTIDSASGLIAANFSNAANQGWAFPAGVVTGTSHTLLVVGNPREQNTQRNCLLNQRAALGEFVGWTFNAVGANDGAITVTQGAFSYQVYSPTISDESAYIANAITGRMSAYLLSRDGGSYVGSVDGQTKAVTRTFTDNTAAPTGTECNIGDLGAFTGSGYGYQDSVAFLVVWNGPISQALANALTANPWRRFAPERTPVFYSIGGAPPGGGGSANRIMLLRRPGLSRIWR